MRKPRILIVEDNDMNRDLLRRRLERQQFEILVAPDGYKALEVARSEVPDVILMDIGLPGIDGLETTRQLKADARTRHIPVIALTAHAMTGDEQIALDAGCDDYDTKPIEMPRLLGKISKAIETQA
jgi:two-component system cell cycle response regulator DivK